MLGPWAGLPVAWSDRDDFDETTFRRDVARCCEAGVPGVYTGGTTGEFYAQEWDEFTAIARAAVEEAHRHDTPMMIGCTATSTRAACRRAAFAAHLHADAIQVALPFWMEVPDDRVLPFFAAVADAADGLPLSIYETTRAKKALSLEQHEAVKRAVPNYLMVKANAGTIGATPNGCRALSEIVNVFVSETRWPELGPHGANGCCSAMVYWNPRLVLQAWDYLKRRDWDQLDTCVAPFKRLHDFLFDAFAPLGFTDTAYDRLVGRATGFLNTSLRCREPYRAPTEADVARLRAWLTAETPEFLQW